MKRHVFYLDKRRDVEIMRRLQRMQRIRKTAVIIRHKVFAELIGCSVSSLRRSIDSLVDAGHIQRAHVSRASRGGYLCVYRVRTDCIYRVASMLRRANRAIEQLTNAQKPAQGRHSEQPRGVASKNVKDNIIDYNRSVDNQRLRDLLQVAKAAGIDDRQRGFLRGAAIRFGVLRAWEALVMAYERGYELADLVKVTWGILKRQEGIA